MVALNSFFALSYKRKLVPIRWRSRLEKGRWSFYVGGYIGMANSPRGLGGLESSRTVMTLPDRTVNFEFRSTSLIDRSKRDYFISFGPEVQARFHWKKILNLFINAGLRITPHVVHAYRMSYNLHQNTDEPFRKAEVRSRVFNFHISCGILFDVQVAKHRTVKI